MRLNIKSAVSACAMALALAGCKADPVSGYFEKLPTRLLPTPAPVVELPPVFQPDGILDGHFDVDTATGNMPFPAGSGDVSHHAHEYDKKNQTTTADFFALSNKGTNTRRKPKLDNIQQAVPAGTRFYINVLNAGINPGAVIEVNGIAMRATDYQNLTAQVVATGTLPPAFTLGDPQRAGDQKLTSLKIAFDSKIPAGKMLIPTAPEECVYPNLLGPKGEHRNGAVVVQAVDASNPQLDPNNGSALQGSLLWEGIIYNHLMTVDPVSGASVDARTCYN